MSESPTAKKSVERIIRASCDEFCRSGLAGAKLDVIACEAKVSKQLIHHYFRTKGELYTAVINDVAESVINDIAITDSQYCSPVDAVKQFLHKVYEVFSLKPYIGGLFTDQSLYGAKQVLQCRHLITQSPVVMDGLTQIIERGQKEGVFKQGLDTNKIIAAAIMMIASSFANGALISVLVPISFETTENRYEWRDFCVQFTINALQA